MPMKWIYSDWITRVLWVGALSMFLVAEAVLIVASRDLPEGHRPILTVGQVIGNAFLASIPAVVGFSGYKAVRRLAAKASLGSEDTTFVLLSRQLLIAEIFTYVAILFVVISFADAWHPK